MMVPEIYRYLFGAFSIHIHTHTHTYIYIYVYMCMYIYIYIYGYTRQEFITGANMKHVADTVN
jgi:hypothetical protein